MQVIVAEENQSGRWDDFIARKETSFNYHRWPWKAVIERTFGWRPYYLMAIEDGTVSGVLPLFWQTSKLFGKILCSIPFFSQAGVVADSDAARDALISEGLRMARDFGASYFELRHRGISVPQLDARTNKVMLACDVYPSAEQIMQRLTTKMRTNVRRALKTELEVEFGGAEFLDDFYRIFSLRMRELGTPVYSRRFFELILKTFPKQAFICRILNQKKPISVALLTGYRNLMEVNWSASDPAAMSLRPNIFLFWHLQCFAGRQGYSIFDFGRSSIGSGTYNFKLQWGAEPVQLYWNYWTPSGKPNELNPENPKYAAAIRLWKKMPLRMTQLLGPMVARHLP